MEVKESNPATSLSDTGESKSMEMQESNAAPGLPATEGESQAMEVQDYIAATSHPATEGHSQVGFDEQLREMIGSDSLDFDTWTSLISETENAFPDNIETISLVYDSFLSKFPLCHLYWKRYADHKTRLCTIDKAVEIFERGVQLATHCVGLWVEYCSFSMYAFEDPSDIRWLFKRGMSCVGKDYLCHTLWDKFIEFEFSQQQWSSIAHLFIQTLRFPTKKLHIYYNNFKKFAALLEKEMDCQNNCSIEVQLEALPDGVVTTPENEIYHVIKDLKDSLNSTLKSKALQKYMSIGEQFYHKACQLNEKIHRFEAYIRRPFFHVKPLDDNQLAKWHQYLDFIEKQDDFDWAVKLYERCLITCANYPEFWMRYVEFMEANGGRELANFALERATQIFLKDLPGIHIFNARFKERIGDLSGARAAYHQCNAESSSYVENVIKEANMERRLGNLESASAVYEKALKMAAERQNLHTVPVLFVHFSRLKYMITGSADAARNVIIDGIQHMRHSRLLLEELINFAMMHEGSRHLSVVEPIIANAIAPGPDVSQGLRTKDREDLSCLYLEFVDLWGTNHDIRKAWNRHINLFPHLMRTTSYNNPISSNQSLSVVNEGAQKGPFVMPNQPSRGQGPNNLIPPTSQERGLLPPESHAIHPDQVSADQLQPKDDDNGAQEGTQQSTHQVVVPSTEDEAASEPMEMTHDSVHESQVDASGPIEPPYEFEQPAEPIGLSEASQEYPKTITRQEQEPEQDHELTKHLNPISVESLSLDCQEKEPQAFIPAVSHEHDIPQETSASNRNMLESCQDTEGNPSTASPNSSPAAGSTKLHNESDENDSVASPLSQQNPCSTQTHPEPEVPPNSGEKLNHVNTNSGGARYGVHGHSQEPEQQASPQQMCPTTEMGAQNQVQNVAHGQIQYQAGPAKENTTTSHAWPVENVPLQGSISSSHSQLYPQPAFSHPQAQMSQYPMQSSDQLGHIQNSQAYNQMLQSYYQQQLLQQQYQQQLLQLQPYLQQQQPLPPPQQPLPLQQSHQPPIQQHEQMFQQQQYLQQQQQIQPPTDQAQQYILYMQQQQQYMQQQQQYQQQYQQQLGQQSKLQGEQGYQQLLQQKQGSQQLLQQHQLQQKGGAQQLLQQHQLQLKEGYQQLQLLQQQKQQQEIHLTHEWGMKESYYQQGQGIAAPGTANVAGPSDSLKPQQPSPKIMTQPRTAGTPRPSVSPHRRQQSCHGASPPRRAGKSRPTRSPSLGHPSPRSK